MTVIDGLARGARRGRHTVLVSRGTYAEHYDSADVVEYDAGPYVDGRRARVDAVAARTGLGRPFQNRSYGRAMEVLPEAEHTLLLHNAPYTGGLAPRRSYPVLYAHNEVLPGPRLAVARALSGFEGVVAVSTWLADRLAQRTPRALRERIVPLVNGVDTSAFRPGSWARGERLRVLFLGRVVPAKGADLLLSACERLASPDVEVRIVGSAGFSSADALTPYEAALRRQAESLPHPVEFVPFVDRYAVAAHYEWADVVVLPARWHDPCPLTLLESMASGAATVITESGGMPEAAGGSAVVVPREDPDRLAEVIDALLTSESLLAQLRHRARERAVELDWSNRSAELEQVLTRLGAPVD